MIDKQLFEKNHRKWAEQNPFGAVFISQDQGAGLELHSTPQQINLLDRQTHQLFYSDQIEMEMQQWIASINLNRVEVLYVYGLGLGYSYSLIKDWLHLKPNHRLIYLEDDPRVISFFLQTPFSEELLDDRQVRLYYWDWTVDNVSMVVNYLSNALLLQEYLFTSLPYYQLNKPIKFQEIQKIIGYAAELKNHWYREYLSYGAGFLTNFFQNSLQLHEAYFANSLYGKFEDVPAIICGAGPSLSKQIPLLKKLGNRCLLFAGGTAMNALNAHDLLPHFGVGVDPNIYQYTRIIANKAFETPFLYRNRLNSKAFNYVSGPKFYIHGSGGYRLSEWLEQELSVPESHHVDEGFNVINLSVSLALALGCRTIIFVGVDLAYTQGLSYSDKMFQHALREGPHDFQTKTATEELIERVDVHGNVILTLWKWVNESNWFTDIARKHPNVEFINATEGGIGFTGIPNQTLADSVQKYFQKEFDIAGRIHLEKIADQKPTIHRADLINVLQNFCDSLARCESILLAMRSKLTHRLQDVTTGQVNSELLSKVVKLEKDLKNETAYTYLLSTFDDSIGPALEHRFSGDFEKLESEKEKQSRQIRIEFKKNTYLWECTVYALSLLRELIDEQEDEPISDDDVFNKALTRELAEKNTTQSSTDVYLFENGHLLIQDEELNLKIDEVFQPKAVQDDFKHQFYLGNDLVGPSRFYLKGHLISETWFYKGLKQGKSRFFYKDGKKESILKYRDDLLEGVQEFYYKDGTLRSYLEYSQGKLHGKIWLFYPNGAVRREIHFKEGKRHGSERYWSKKGHLLIEAEYREDKPIGVAREWYENGKMAKEVTYNAQERSIQIKRWDEAGVEVETEKLFPPDYFDLVSIHTNALTDSLDNLYQQFSKFVPTALEMGLNEKEYQEYRSQLKEVEGQVSHLKHLQEAMNLESEAGREPLWKSSSARREMEHLLKDLLKQMSGNISYMQEILRKKFNKNDSP